MALQCEYSALIFFVNFVQIVLELQDLSGACVVGTDGLDPQQSSAEPGRADFDTLRRAYISSYLIMA